MNEVLEMMNLTWCKDRVITERPTSRGTLGGELRKMVIACEIVNYAPVLVFDDITADLDEQVAYEILRCLQVLASRGHTVIASFQNPQLQTFDVLHAVVVVRDGRSIYSSLVENIYSFFCEESVYSYSMPEDKSVHDVGKFLMDIANGVERPHGQRYAPEAAQLQSSFEASKFFEKRIGSDSTYDNYQMVSVLPEKAVPYSETLCDFSVSRTLKQSIIQFKRAVYLKCRETGILKTLLGASIFLSCLFGYMVFDITSTFDYLLSLLGMPSAEVTTLTGCLYVFSIVPFGMQTLNAHIFHQKFNVFLFERRGKWVSSFGYFFASFIPEIVVSVACSLIFTNIVYFMVNLNEGRAHWIFIA